MAGYRGAWVEVSYDRYQPSGLLGPGCCGWHLGDWTGLWLVMATVPSAMKVPVVAPDVKLFLLDASKPSSPEKGATQSRNNPCYLELQDIHVCLSGINRPFEAARCDGD